MKSGWKFMLLILVLLIGFVSLDNPVSKSVRSSVASFFTEARRDSVTPIQTNGTLRVTNEESVVVDVVERVSPAVVTVGVTKTRSRLQYRMNPFFDPFFGLMPQEDPEPQKVEQDIGSGFIVDKNGLIVTNKHVVSESGAAYKVITKDNKTFDVEKIYRDPSNDLAILKISASNLPIVEMGDSDKMKVGQLAIAIGTALGEFRSTVTTGVISGIGRGITAGDPFFGAVEKLDNVIQTSAAINPGNSGGPLLNSSGQVIGINVAVSAEGQNIGFALPINVVREALSNFNTTGQFNRPYLGVRYKMVSRNLAITNEIPEGAYVMEVVEESPASAAGVQTDDIITKIDGEKVTESTDLSSIIAKKKVGDTVVLTIDRNGEQSTIRVTLGNASDQ